MSETTDSKVLMAEYEIGQQTQQFLQSPTGRYVEGRTRQDIEQAKDELLALDPYEFDSLIKLQNAIMAIKQKAIYPEKLRGYLQEAIVNGDQARNVLESGDE